MTYIKQLDALRAIAVSLVIWWHWVPESHPLNSFEFGSIGINLFFVLSGFLITRILLNNRLKSEAAGVSRGTVTKNFYVRRALRIFPIYYLTIGFVWLTAPYVGTEIRSSVWYFVTYTSNFYFFARQEWDGMLSHMWSLAVEEQFYLLWPWLVLFLDKRRLPLLMGLFILTGIISKVILMDFHIFVAFTTCSFDAFGMGGLLAWIITFRKDLLPRFHRLLSLLTAASFIVWSLPRLGVLTGIFDYFPVDILHVFFCSWIITYVYVNAATNRPQFDFILSNPVLIFLGKISYGIYLYHLLIPVFVVSAIQKAIVPVPHTASLVAFLYQPYVFAFLNLAVLGLVAWLSFLLIEQPFLRLKDGFAYLKS